ncbi:MAG: cytochrome c family protein [Gammaproteobacteria bacterium]|nr:cytochrome c family protein [Gammaproteobacteria bacterium]
MTSVSHAHIRQRHTRSSLLTLPLLLLGGLLASSTAIADKLSHTTAEACAGCHQEIYNEWKSSMHANSSAFKDPVHGAMYRKVAGDPGKEGVGKDGKPPVCLQCHAPAAALDGKTKLDALPAYNDGVTCTTCHAMEHYQGIHGDDGKMKLGISAYTLSDSLQGPSGIDRGPGNPEAFHPMPMKGNSALLRGPGACLGCHDQRNNSHAVPLCMTGAEFRQADSFNCQQCHMAVKTSADGRSHADHTMAGGHTPGMVERSVVLTVTASKNGDQIDAVVNLRNMLPHNVPTGAPFRNMFLKVSGIDAAGKTVWANYQTHPMKEDPKSMFMLKLLDDAGTPTSPPTAKKLGEDSRLKPNESRDINYQMPMNGVAKVRAELFYDLLLPPLKAALKTVPDNLKQSHRVAFGEISL